MASAIAGFTPTTPPASSGSTGLGAMTGGDFLNLMIKQLQQQDPLNPTDSNQLLTQMSQISQLQSNNAMEKNLDGLTLQQSIGAGGNLIGKTVQGLNANGDPINGIVTSVKVQDKKVYLELDSAAELPMENVTQIAPTSAANASTLAAALPQLQSLLQNSGGTNSSALTSLLSALGMK